MARGFASGVNRALLKKAMQQQGIESPKRQTKVKLAGSKSAGQEAEDALYFGLKALKIPFEPQFPWGKDLDPPRKFQSDAAILHAKLLVEVDGGVHGIQDKRERDLARQNLGIAAGWRFLRFTPDQAKDGSAAIAVQDFLKKEQG